MDHLGILTEGDHVAIITRVFWRFVNGPAISQNVLTSEQVHSSDAYPSVDLLAGAGWLSWCLGFRRLPFPPIPVRQCSTERFLRSQWKRPVSPNSDFTGHKFLRPKSIHDADIVEEYSKDYMYLSCIQFINSVSTYPGHRPKISRPSVCRSKRPRYVGTHRCLTTSPL